MIEKTGLNQLKAVLYQEWNTGEKPPAVSESPEQSRLSIQDYLRIPLDKLPDDYPDTEKKSMLADLRESCGKCEGCSLRQSAKNLVFGEGNPDTDLVFVGEAPGADEDVLSRPFVGRAGALLTKTLAELGIPRPTIYICNILKHRPPENRDPLPAEVEACTPFLVRQLEIIRPRLAITMGNHSTKYLLNTTDGITKTRGKPAQSRWGFTVFPIYHPAYILRNNNALPDFQNDLKTALEMYRSQKA